MSETLTLINACERPLEYEIHRHCFAGLNRAAALPGGSNDGSKVTGADSTGLCSRAAEMTLASRVDCDIFDDAGPETTQAQLASEAAGDASDDGDDPQGIGC